MFGFSGLLRGGSTRGRCNVLLAFTKWAFDIKQGRTEEYNRSEDIEELDRERE